MQDDRNGTLPIAIRCLGKSQQVMEWWLLKFAEGWQDCPCCLLNDTQNHILLTIIILFGGFCTKLKCLNVEGCGNDHRRDEEDGR